MPTFSDAEEKAMQQRARQQPEFKKFLGEEQVRSLILLGGSVDVLRPITSESLV